MRRKLGDHRPPAVVAGLGLRHGVVVVLLRRVGHGQVALRQGRRLHRRHGLHVRLDQPGHRARHRARRAHGLAVRRQRVRRRHHHDRPAGHRSARCGCAGASSSQARERLQAAEADARAPARSRRPRRDVDAAAAADAAALGGRLGRQRHLHHVRPDHAAARAGHRLHRRRVPGRRWCRRRSGRPSSSRGHGFWTSLENAIVGPFIAIISFVCSIGNVPLAAALWKGGISFGGVIAFIFADLIAFPLLMIYRRYYGTRLMLRMLAVFWALMSTAGLHHRVHLPRRRPRADHPADHGRAGPLLVELHDVPQHRLPGAVRRPVLDSTATGSGSARATATPATRSAACRSRWRTRRRRVGHGGERVLLLLGPLRRALRRSGPARATAPAPSTAETMHRHRRRSTRWTQQRIMERLDAHGVERPHHRRGGACNCAPTEGTPAFDAVVAGIRARHAQAHTDAGGGRRHDEPGRGGRPRSSASSAGEHSAELRKQVRGKH